MSKKICVIGTGYVGLIAAVGLADFGNEVIASDVDERKIEGLKQGRVPFYEPGIQGYLERNVNSGRLSFTTDQGRGIRRAEVVFIAVGTPGQEDGQADLSLVEQVVEIIAANLNAYKVIVCKSTVPIGTNRKIKNRLKALLKAADREAEFDVVSNPEFLREGRGVYDFFHPDRTVLGCESERSRQVMTDVYRTLNLISTPFVWCNPETAELIKYASNAFLAAKITFINQMANLAEAAGADIHVIAKAMGMDGRISPKFLHPGPGYGGSCFPKDTQALVKTGEAWGVDMSLIRTVIEANEEQKMRMVRKFTGLLGGDLTNKTAAVLGLTFKSETDDIRESPAIKIVAALLKAGARVQAHDPQGMANFSRLFPEVKCCQDEFEALAGADGVLLLTEWNEYRSLDLHKAGNVMREKIILDTRNLLDPREVRAWGFVYQGVGRGEAPAGQ
ncbi:MAG: UDP-glucose/GDP-mannose dehydrogenase family protein [Spirochaetales bacterium]|jgi:UDPglucose 6-dehydrogenase|nr:UDP-glucose/GDP-mannose dehydrogenase family protein [Spirochaetales bacterium]